MKKKGLLFYVFGLILLNSLGIWQLYRLQWKNNLVHQLTQAPFLTPLTLKESLEKADPYFYPLTLEGTIDPEVFYLIGKPLNGKAGYHAIARFLTSDGKSILINLGWTPLKDVSINPHAPFSIKVIIYPIEKSWVSPSHTPQKNEWGYIDPLQMGGGGAPFCVKPLESIPFIENLTPHAALPTLRNNHLSYALTWFILAIIWGVGFRLFKI